MELGFFKWLEAKQDERVLVIMRGLPGSGKSTTALKVLKKLGGSPDGHIFSADNFWIPETRKLRKSGQYVSPEDEKAEYRKNWKGEKLQGAHRAVLDEFKLAVDNGVTPLILDNNNVRKGDGRSYAVYADKAGYEIRIQEPESEIWKEFSGYLKDRKNNKEKLEEFAEYLFDACQHGVPMKTIQKFIARWQSGLTVEDILGYKPGPKHKRKGAPNKKRVEKK